MDYPHGKFGDCSFNRFGLSCGQTDTHTDADECLTPQSCDCRRHNLAQTEAFNMAQNRRLCKLVAASGTTHS